MQKGRTIDLRLDLPGFGLPGLGRRLLTQSLLMREVLMMTAPKSWRQE